MLRIFYPDEDAASAYDIPFEKLYKSGIRGVIFDIDNTLVPHDAPADERAKKLFLRQVPATFIKETSRGEEDT